MAKRNQGQKPKISVVLEEDTFKKLNDFCKSHYNAEKSKVVEEAIKKFLEEKS